MLSFLILITIIVVLFILISLCVSLLSGRGGKVSAKRGDIWAAGITLFMLMYGTLPFSAHTPALLFQAIINEPYVCLLLSSHTLLYHFVRIAFRLLLI